MPRRSGVLAKVEAMGARVVKELKSQISTAESELERLQSQLGQWVAVLAGGGKAKGLRRSPRIRTAPRSPTVNGRRKKPAGRPTRRKTTGPKIDWDRVLAKLPAQFSMDQLTKGTPQLNRNPQARYIALARWTRGKQVKKIEKGMYRRS